MRKSKFNSLFREYVKANLSPTSAERELITAIYKSVCDLLGFSQCLQIGSYPRFTSITPVHDLDILYVIGKRLSNDPDPSQVMNDLQELLESQYVNPTSYGIQIKRQTHSITLVFLSGIVEIFSVDIVPAYIDGQNEYRLDKYVVPEILSKTDHKKRQQAYEEIAKSQHHMSWIPSDPRGYIKITSEIDGANNDFRKAVKFVKGWSRLCKDMDENFKLKSFHIERIITEYFRQQRDIEIFDAVFWFFCDLPKNLERSRIVDRADTTKKIDAYVDSLSTEEKRLMIQARDYFLIKLERFSEQSKVENLLESGLHSRANGVAGFSTEEYLLDSRVPVLLDDGESLSIHAEISVPDGSVRKFILDLTGIVPAEREVDFQIVEKCPGASYKWKVKNDDRCEEPRGEITDHRTRNNPERTKYKGKHFAECYAIKGGVCVARARQNIVI
jgi:hypothetical protein